MTKEEMQFIRQAIREEVVTLIRERETQPQSEPEPILEPVLEPEPVLESEPVSKKTSRRRPKKLDNIRIPWFEPLYCETRRYSGYQVRSLLTVEDCAKPDPIDAALHRELELSPDDKRVRVNWQGDYYDSVTVEWDEWTTQYNLQRRNLRPELLRPGDKIKFRVDRSWATRQPRQHSPADGEIDQPLLKLVAKEPETE